MSNIETALIIANNQHGVVTRSQLISYDIAESSVEKILRSTIWEHVCRGVYKVRGSENTWRQKAAITVFSCGKNALLSHESALINLELFYENLDKRYRKRRPAHKQELIHVVTDREIRYVKNVFFHRSLSMPKRKSPYVVYGIPQVSCERAIVDCAQQLTEYELSNILDNALRRNLVTIQSLTTMVRSLHSAPGREKNRLKIILNSYKDTLSSSESVLEERIKVLLNKHFGFEVTQQHVVNINSKKYRLDFAITNKKIAIEADGFAFHRSRIQFDNDRSRQNDLISAGWKVIRITSKFSNNEIIEAVHAAVQSVLG